MNEEWFSPDAYQVRIRAGVARKTIPTATPKSNNPKFEAQEKFFKTSEQLRFLFIYIFPRSANKCIRMQEIRRVDMVNGIIYFIFDVPLV